MHEQIEFLDVFLSLSKCMEVMKYVKYRIQFSISCVVDVPHVDFYKSRPAQFFTDPPPPLSITLKVMSSDG